MLAYQQASMLAYRMGVAWSTMLAYQQASMLAYRIVGAWPTMLAYSNQTITYLNFRNTLFRNRFFDPMSFLRRLLGRSLCLLHWLL